LQQFIAMNVGIQNGKQLQQKKSMINKIRVLYNSKG